MAAINYVMAAALVDPNVSFGQTGDPTNYDLLIWKTAQIPEAVLEARWLANEKERQIKIISFAMQTQVTSGFLSDALVPGQFRKYDSDIQGQIAVIGALAYLSPFPGVTPPSSYIMSSVDPATGIREFAPHNYFQIYQLMSDLGIFSGNLQNVLANKITQIMTVNTGSPHTDLDVVYSITWP